jgi:hypothetical protein
VILFLGIYQRNVSQDAIETPVIPMCIAALFTIAKLWKQPRCPRTDEWVKKMYIFTTEFHSAIGNNDM